MNQAVNIIDFQQATRRYIPEDKTHHNHRFENLKSYNNKLYILFLYIHENSRDAIFE
jgi:hypothetical protein